MSKARLGITAVVLEGRSQGEAARAYGVSRGRVSRLVLDTGPRARQRSSPLQAVEDLPAGDPGEHDRADHQARKELAGRGLDAELPNEFWQAEVTHYRLAGGTDTEILSWLDDHSQLVLRVTAWNQVTGPVVLAEFRAAVAARGAPP